MKIIRGLRKRHYVIRVAICVIEAALIAGMLGCDGGYDLTIASTTGGLVSVPGEGTLTYHEGTVVELVAEADQGYDFVNWTGDVDTVDDVNSAVTSITMNDDYSVTANFDLKPEEEEAPTEVRLGTCLPETGAFYGFGEQGFGMQKAVDDQNALGGIYLSEWNVTVPVRLIIKDNESDFAKVGPLSEDLVLTDEVHGLLSPNGPTAMHDPTSVVANEYGVPHVIAGCYFEVWYEGLRSEEDWPYTWLSGFAMTTRTAPPRDVQGYTLADTWFMYMDEVDAKANTNMIAGVFANSDAHGIAWYNTFPGLMEAYGMTVVGAEDELGMFLTSDTDFTSIIHEWQDAGAEIIWGSCPAPNFAMLLSQCYEEGFQPKIAVVSRAVFDAPEDLTTWLATPSLGWGVGTELWWDPGYDAADGASSALVAEQRPRWLKIGLRRRASHFIGVSEAAIWQHR